MGMTPISEELRNRKPRKKSPRGSKLDGRSIQILELRDGRGNTFRWIRSDLEKQGVKVSLSRLYEFYTKCTGKK
jgi:hypothetical protein